MTNCSPFSLTFPVLGCGTWAWGNRFLLDYNPQMDQELQKVFNFLVDQGVTFFDTGDSYGTGVLKGRSEILLGQFGKNYGGKNKDRLILATKLAPYPWRLTSQAMISAAQQSSDRLGRPIDLVQLHWSTRNYFPWQEKPLLKRLAKIYHEEVESLCYHRDDYIAINGLIHVIMFLRFPLTLWVLIFEN
jgi:pyridoxine 4-dehydrogenase